MSDQEIRPSLLCGRRSLRACAFGLILLGVCIFAWGLNYKLSLYDPPHAPSHRIPVAKLLYGEKRTTLPELDLRHVTDLSRLLPFSLLALAGFTLLSARFFTGSARWGFVPGGADSPPEFAVNEPVLSRPPPSFR